MITGEIRPLAEYPSPETPENRPSRAERGRVEPNLFQKDAREVIKRIMEDLPRNAGNAE